MPLPAPAHAGLALARRTAWEARRRAGEMRRKLRLRRVGQALGPQLVRPEGPVEADVVVYFAEGVDRLYQLDQWLPVLERLGERCRVLVLVRHLGTLRAVASRTVLPVMYVPSFRQLISLYERVELKLAIYVNNGDRNFQSLSSSCMLHVHVGHGDSDKLSSGSNQVKAYDRVFVAGPLAAKRYSDALLELDDDKLVVVGRPQLDLDAADSLPRSPRRTVLYAPTWEGATESNNWTSVDRFGMRIVDAVLALPDVRLVYKPHPRTAGSRHLEVAAAHRTIVRMIEAANADEDRPGHVVAANGDILPMFASCDALVSDVSSVILDFLYRRPAQPIFLTDRADDRDRLVATSHVAQGADVIDSSTIDTFGRLLAARLDHDERREDRARVRKAYFGELTPGASMAGFIEEVERLIETRDRLLAARQSSRRVT